VIEYGTPLDEDPRQARRRAAVGCEETAFLAPSARYSTIFATGVVDLTTPVARLLDVMPGRSGKALCDWVNGGTLA